jgi:hypothetical protein
MSWGYVAIGAGTLIGGYLSGKGAKDASKDQADASKEATAETRRQFDLSREDLAPWRNAGQASLNRLRQRMGISPTAISGEPLKSKEEWIASDYHPTNKTIDLGDIGVKGDPQSVNDLIARELQKNGPDQGYADYVKSYNDRLATSPGEPGVGGGGGDLLRRFTMDDFQNDPVVQASMRFGLDEGTKGVNRMFAARGMSKSGGAIKALERFASDYVGNQAGASQQRFVGDQANEFNKLAAVSGIGQAATTTTAQLGANASNQIGNNLIGSANARGAASIAGSNAYSGALNNLGNMYQQRYYMDQLNNRSNSVSGNSTSDFYT